MKTINTILGIGLGLALLTGCGAQDRYQIKCYDGTSCNKIEGLDGTSVNPSDYNSKNIPEYKIEGLNETSINPDDYKSNKVDGLEGLSISPSDSNKGENSK